LRKVDPNPLNLWENPLFTGVNPRVEQKQIKGAYGGLPPCGAKKYKRGLTGVYPRVEQKSIRGGLRGLAPVD